MGTKSFREVDEKNWDDFVQLFEGKGCPSYCWCMAWRPLPGSRQQASNAVRKKSMKRIVTAGTPVGILAYDGSEPLAWCSNAPRASHRPLGGAEYAGIPEEAIWSLVCFFIPRRLRRQGLMTQLLQAAVAVARNRGARVIEAYPVDPDSPSYRFMGFVSKFQRTGFAETGRAGKRRHVMHLMLE
jgi:GNAT superfamily N-acetyltransferase